MKLKLVEGLEVPKILLMIGIDMIVSVFLILISNIKIQYFDGSFKVFTKKDIYKLFID